MDYWEIYRTFQKNPKYRMVLQDIEKGIGHHSGNIWRGVPKWSYLHDHRRKISTKVKEVALEFLESIGFITEQIGPAYPDGYPIIFLNVEGDYVKKYYEWEQAVLLQFGTKY